MMDLFEKFERLSAKIATMLGDRKDFGVPDWKNANHYDATFDYASLANILHYEAYDETTDIFHNKNSLGFVLEATTLLGAGDETSKVFARIITDMLPPNADLQFLLWGSDKVGAILDRFKESRKSHPTFAQLAQSRIEYLKKGAYKSLIKNGANLIRHFRLFISVSMPKGATNHTKALSLLRDNIMSALITIHMHTRKIEISNFINFISDILHPKNEVYADDKHWNQYDCLSQQLINTNTLIKHYPDYLLFEGENSATVAVSYNVREFPSHAALFEMDEAIGKLFDKINQITCPFLISFTIRLAKNANASFFNTLKVIDSEKSANSKERIFLTHLVKKAQELKLVQSRLNDGDKLVETYFQITLFSDPEKIVASENALMALYESIGFKLQKIRYLQLQSFLSLLPMRITELVRDFKAFGRFYTMTAFNAANLAPILSEWQGTQTPHMLLVGRRGQLCTFSPFDNKKGNFNVAIAANSGSGKSVFGQEYVSGLLATGGKVWVIDIGRSFQRTCQYAGGAFIDFDLKQPLCINPFSTICDFEDSIELLKPLLAVMARPSSKVSDEEHVYLERAIKAAWREARNKATISTVSHWLSNHESQLAQNLGHLLYSYTKDGAFAPYFEGEANVDLSNSFVVLELEGLLSNPRFMRVVLMALTLQINRAMFLDNKSQTKTLLVDEYWRYTVNVTDDVGSQIGEFISALARTTRKYNGSLITIVQSVEDYFTNPSAKAVYTNSDYAIVMSQKEETVENIKANHQLSMNPMLEKLYMSLEKTDEYSECIIKGPSGLSLQRLILDPYSRILYTSTGEQFETLKKYQAAGLSVFEAVKRVAEEVIGV